jgi:cytochrome P450
MAPPKMVLMTYWRPIPAVVWSKLAWKLQGSTLNNFLLAMSLHPHIVKRAQKELDRVVGANRMATWEDQKDHPYIRALIKENLQWRPVNKFRMPHSTSEDDWYQDYFIPKGSAIMLNWW